MAHPTEASHADRPGEFPTVVDEAENSPRWIPLVGLALVAIALLFAAYRAGRADAPAELVPEGETEVAPAVEPEKIEAAPVAPPPPVPTPAAAAPPG